MASHLTVEEREVIAQMHGAGKTQTQLADRLGRSKSTISRELRRNRSRNGYWAAAAQRRAERAAVDGQDAAAGELQSGLWDLNEGGPDSSSIRAAKRQEEVGDGVGPLAAAPREIGKLSGSPLSIPRELGLCSSPVLLAAD
jgi:hypothetical protein